MADPEADWWTITDIAEHLGVKRQTVERYRHPRRPGPDGPVRAAELPEPDRHIGATPVWRPERIIGWERPGQGAGGGRPRPAQNAAAPPPGGSTR
jgi:hypothetical protein